MGHDSNCPICLLKTPDFKVIDDTGDYGEQIIYDCARCGRFMITRIACGRLESQKNLNRASLSAWMRMQSEFKKPMPKITDSMLNNLIENLPDYTPSQKQSILLKILAEKTEYPGQSVLLVPRFDYPLAWAINEDELVFHAKSLIKEGLIEIPKEDELEKDILTTFVVVTSKGWDNLQNVSFGNTPWEPIVKHRSQHTQSQVSHWDVFICHASEDKEDFVRPLAQALSQRGINVWYDEFTLKVGDSLRRAIDQGLSQSRWGIVVISPNFLRKEWPQRELDGLTAREIEGRKVILPVWHDIDVDEVRRYSPILADRVATKSYSGLDRVVADLLDAMN